MRPLFSCYGVELEYMIVRHEDYAVAPWSDRLLVDPLTGQPVSDIARGDVTWSNELTAHVIELKTTDPVASLDGVSDAFAREVFEVNERLSLHGARLLPTAMHPTMRPEEAVLWKHEYSEVYETFDRIFDCRGHGWSNLQSVHLNLPFANDEEFGRLHAAIRLVLPLLPALAASSPLVEGKFTGFADNRLAFYRGNSVKVPQLCGNVIPEPVFTRSDYEREIFHPIRGALALHDPAGVLLPEFSNSRGAIARFDRGSVEIRLLDIQECPAADLAIVRLVVALLRELVGETYLTYETQKAVPVEPLATVFNQCVAHADHAVIEEPGILRAFGCEPDERSCTAHGLWQRAISRLDPDASASPAEKAALRTLATRGTLSRRMCEALPSEPTPADIRQLYTRLAACLQSNAPFVP